MNHLDRFRERAMIRLLVVVTALVLLPASRAVAQGTSGTLPGPIDSRQLDVYARQLTLSPSQRLAMEAAHDDYRRQFRLLRDGEIAAFLREQSAVQGGIPKREVVEELLEKVEQINAKIAVLDDGLFDQLLPILSEQQQAIVPRLRLARERRRYEVQQTAAAFGRRTVDLSDPFRDLDLTPEELSVADATLASYERRMTSIMRKQNKAIIRMTLDMMDVLAERGYVDISQERLLEDPKLLQEVVGQIGGIYEDLRGKVAAYSDDLRELNDRTWRQIAAVIPPEQGRRLRNAYYKGAYRSLAGLVARSDDDWMTKALRLDDLTSEQRAALEPVAAEHQRQIEQLLATGVTAADAFWDGFSPFEMNPERNEKFRADLAELQGKATEATEQAEETLTQQLGADAVADLRRRAGELDAAPEPAAAQAAGGAGEGEDEAADAIAFAGDQFLPERISRADVRRYAKQLQLDEGMSTVLDTLHHDYLQRVAALDVFDRLRDARQAANDDEATEPAADRIDRVFALRREALEAMAGADRAFFDDLRALVGTDKESLVDRVRKSRLRVTWSGRASARYALGRDVSNEAGVDLVTLVLEQQPTTDELAKLDAILGAYEDRATDSFRARLDAQLEMQKMSDRWAGEIQAASREDLAAIIELQQRYREAMRAPTERVRRTNEAIAELNRRTLETALGALSPERGRVIRRAYDLAAFPSIYVDPVAVHDQLTRALALEELTPEQRSKLVELDAAYRADYERLSREMIDHLPRSAVNVVGLEPAAFKEWQTHQQQLAKVRFDRNELSSRAISRLATTLTPDQVRRIGGLPKPPGEDDFYFYR